MMVGSSAYTFLLKKFTRRASVVMWRLYTSRTAGDVKNSWMIERQRRQALMVRDVPDVLKRRPT